MFGFVGGFIDAGNTMSAPDGGIGRRLRELPAFEPPAGGWLALERRRRRQSRRPLAGWALAASVAVTTIVGVGVVGLRQPGGADNVGTADLAARSQHLDRLLAEVHRQPASFDSTRVVQRAELERQLALVDLQINYADSGTAKALWQDRLSLMRQLVAAHGEDSVASNTDYVEY